MARVWCSRCRALVDLASGGSLRFAVVFARARATARVDRPADEDILAWNSCIGNGSPKSLLVARKNTGKKVADARLRLHDVRALSTRVSESQNIKVFGGVFESIHTELYSSLMHERACKAIVVRDSAVSTS